MANTGRSRIVKQGEGLRGLQPPFEEHLSLVICFILPKLLINKIFYEVFPLPHSTACEATNKRLNTRMAPTCDWMIKIVKVDKLYLNSLLVSIVNRVSQSGTIKYQCE